MAVLRRTLLAFIAIIAQVRHAQSQWDTRPYFDEYDQVEKRHSSELVQQLETVQDEALLLFTEFTARSGGEYNGFVRTLHRFGNGRASGLDSDYLKNAPDHCRSTFEKHLKKIELNAYKSASYSAENHHKFFLGPMTVFRMHLNKTENYIRRTKKNIQICSNNSKINISCEVAPNVIRWRKLAAAEINRVKADIVNTRPVYRDLLVHFKHRLIRIYKGAETKLKIATDYFRKCIEQKT